MRKHESPPNYADHLRSIASSTTDALIAIDRAGVVLSWNLAAEGMFGYSR